MLQMSTEEKSEPDTGRLPRAHTNFSTAQRGTIMISWLLYYYPALRRRLFRVAVESRDRSISRVFLRAYVAVT